MDCGGKHEKQGLVNLGPQVHLNFDQGLYKPICCALAFTVLIT